VLCPKCGYLVTTRRPTCPKCNNPLPEEGEWSDESSIDRLTPPNILKESPKPEPLTPAKTSPDNNIEEPPRKSSSAVSADKPGPKEKTPPPVESSEPGPLFKAEKPIEPKKEAAPKPAISVKPEVVSTPEKVFKPDKPSPEPRHEEKPKITPPVKTDRVIEHQTTPAPYHADSATFSSELSTDWIEKYARSHVSPIPERAGLGVRFWAGLLDWILLTAIGVVVLLAGRLMIALLNGAQYTPWELLRLLSLPAGGVWIVLVILYFVIFTVTTGQTPGATVMDIRVIDASSNHLPSAGKAFVRMAVYIAGILALGAGCWAAIFDPNRRTWHDRATGTKVTPVIKI